MLPLYNYDQTSKEHEDVMWGYGMWWGGLIWLILTAALVWTLVATNRPARPTRPNALDILEERFARGEIDADTYRSTRTELERN
jgi:putative membrane protein